MDLGGGPPVQKTPESQAPSRSEGLSKSEKSLKSTEKKEKKKSSWYNVRDSLILMCSNGFCFFVFGTAVTKNMSFKFLSSFCKVISAVLCVVVLQQHLF